MTGADVPDDPWSLPPHKSRNDLAHSLASHREFCAACQPNVDAILVALEGGSIDDVREVESL